MQQFPDWNRQDLEYELHTQWGLLKHYETVGVPSRANEMMRPTTAEPSK